MVDIASIALAATVGVFYLLNGDAQAREEATTRRPRRRNNRRRTGGLQTPNGGTSSDGIVFSTKKGASKTDFFWDGIFSSVFMCTMLYLYHVTFKFCLRVLSSMGVRVSSSGK